MNLWQVSSGKQMWICRRHCGWSPLDLIAVASFLWATLCGAVVLFIIWVMVCHNIWMYLVHTKKKAHQKQEIARNQCECTLSPDTVPSCTFHHCFPDLDKIPINQGGSPLSPASWSWRSICRPGHCSWSKGCFRPAFSCFRVASWTRNRI